MVNSNILTIATIFLITFLISPISNTLSEAATNPLENISNNEKERLLNWVNSHCEKQFSSFDFLVQDQRIVCKSGKDEEVPEDYYKLNGSRHVRPDPTKVIPMELIFFVVITVGYVFILMVNLIVARKVQYFKSLITILIMAAPGFAFVYAGTIYQNKFLNQDVDFIRMHGHGRINSFLLRACCDDLFSYGPPPLVYAAVDTGSLEMVKFVVEEMKIPPNQTYMNVLPLALAVNHRMTDIVDYLIQFAPDNPKDYGEYALNTSILLGRLDFVQNLIEMINSEYKSRRINYQKPGVPWISRRSSLYIAVDRERFEIAKILLENGADPNLPNTYDQKTPFDAARKNQNSRMIALLQQHSQ